MISLCTECCLVGLLVGCLHVPFVCNKTLHCSYSMGESNLSLIVVVGSCLKIIVLK